MNSFLLHATQDYTFIVRLNAGYARFPLNNYGTTKAGQPPGLPRRALF
jgi:hypothetical protein